MKKTNLLLILIGLLVTSCATDDVIHEITPNVTEEVELPMQFSTYQHNLSRTTPAEVGLEKQSLDFGVYAYKTRTTGSGTETSLVMNNYLVGFYEVVGTSWRGYKYGTPVSGAWFYEGLGNSDGAKYSAALTTEAGDDAAQSKNPNQYLKYWDLSYDNTVFYAYAPYSNSDVVNFTNYKLTVPLTTTHYAYNSTVNSTVKSATGGVATVPLHFTPIGSSICLAFYADIPGYDVKIINLDGKGGDASTNKGVFLMFSQQTGTPATWAAGQYSGFSGGNIVVDYTDPANITVSTGTATTLTQMNFVDLPTTNLPSTYNTIPVFSQIVTEQPTDNSTTGFTLNLSIELTAKDTAETIKVLGSKAYVPAEFTQWKSNTCYTYIFKITKDITGTTGSHDGNPSVDPTGEGALIPIIFEDVTITPLTNVYYCDGYSISLNKEDISLAVGATEVVTATTKKEDGKAAATVAWTSSDTSVATVAPDTDPNKCTITAVASGTATITATYGSVSATCTVTVP